ncbi:MAG TPA: hypothetical protein VMT52_13625 [Planctomycetota bacterium]|nr:hypothetical protein [Planctomycetota bacterium]
MNAATPVPRTLRPILCAALLLPGGLLCAPQGADKVPPAPEESYSPVFHLRDGGRVSGAPNLDTLTVRTRYGTLRIPLTDVVQARFAPRLPEAERRAIEEAIGRLGSEDPEERESAVAVLRAAGRPSRRFLAEAATSSDGEVKRRAAALLAEAPAAADDPGRTDDALEPLAYGEDDEVVTVGFTVRGHVEEDSFGVTSPFGTLDLRTGDVVLLDVQTARRVTMSVTVPSKMIVPASWLKTRILVHKGRKLELRARGQITVAQYNLTSGPEGTTRYSGGTFQGFPMLSLVARVGKDGKPFSVGKAFTGKAPADGPLYLGIVPFRRVDLAAMGSYAVKVEIGK